MKDLAPDIFRQRLLLEGFYARTMDQEAVESYLTDLAAAVNLRAYGRPVIFAPRPDQGRPENMGYDAFLPLIDSGISAYFWTADSFVSVVIFSCTAFEPQAAADFTRKYLQVTNELIVHPF